MSWQQFPDRLPDRRAVPSNFSVGKLGCGQREIFLTAWRNGYDRLPEYSCDRDLEVNPYAVGGIYAGEHEEDVAPHNPVHQLQGEAEVVRSRMNGMLFRWGKTDR